MSEIIEIEDFKAARICTDLCEFAHFYREGRAVIYHDNPGIFEIGKGEAEAIAEMAMRADTEITKLKSQLEDFKEAAERICFFDWSDNDPDAVRAIGALRILIHGSAK